MESEVQGEWTLVLTDNQEIHSLNQQFRNKDKPTDVLSFISDIEGYLGDVVISVETAKEQSKEFGCSLIDELTRLTVHGLLHLSGYEHEKVKPSVGRTMRKKEELLLSEFLI